MRNTLTPTHIVAAFYIIAAFKMESMVMKQFTRMKFIFVNLQTSIS